MTRAAWIGTFTIILLACGALPACSQEDESQKIIAECSDPPPQAVDSCLERARVEEETNPSPELQTLVAKLIQRQIQLSESAQPPAIEAPPTEEDHGVTSYNVAPSLPPPSPDLLGSTPSEPAQQPQDYVPPDPQQPGDQITTMDLTPPAPPSSTSPQGGDPYESPPVSTATDETPPDQQGDPSDAGRSDQDGQPPTGDDKKTPTPPVQASGTGRALE